jgi:hypothetical protein
MKSLCGLEQHFGRLLDRLPSDPDEVFEFTTEILPPIEKPLSTDAVVTHARFWVYNDIPVDRVLLYTHHRTLRLLGLFLLSRLCVLPSLVLPSFSRRVSSDQRTEKSGLLGIVYVLQGQEPRFSTWPRCF